MLSQKEEYRISLTGMLIMAVLTLATGFAVFSVMQRQSETTLSKSLGLALQMRVDRLVNTLEMGIDDTARLAARPGILNALHSGVRNPIRTVDRVTLQHTVESLVPIPYSAIAIYNEHGAVLAQQGQFSTSPKLSVPLNTSSATTRAYLLRDQGMALHVDTSVIQDRQRLGRISIQADLRTLDTMFLDARSIGKTGILALCAPLQQEMACYSTHAPHVLPRIPRYESGKPLPMSQALDGLTGVVTAMDHRKQHVVAAFSPVGTLGLGMVMKIDTAELYQPIYAQMKVIVPLLLLLLVSGAVLLRWRVLPMARNLVRVSDEAKASNVRLLTSEAALRTLNALSPVGIFHANQLGELDYVNERFCKITGLSVDHALGQGWMSTLHPEDSENVCAAWASAVCHSLPFHMEYRFQNPNGHVTWVLGQATNEQVIEGKRAGLVGTLTDITERKSIETALSQSEANFRALTENADVGILVHFQGKHVFANARLLMMLGYTLNEFRETEMQDVVHPSKLDKVRSHYLTGIPDQDEPKVFETLLLTKNGTPVPVELTAAKTTWKDQPAGLVLLRDIRERKETEERMHKLSSAIEQTADSVMITDTTGLIEYVNPAFENTTGYTREEAVGMTPRIMKSEKQSNIFYKKLWNTILAGEVFRAIFINRRKNGGLYYEEKTITPLKDADGRTTHFVSTGKDVSERMRIQKRLRYNAEHDALTNLPNRTLLFDRLKHALTRAQRNNQLVAVLFVDLDRFKNINDSLGHEVGDQLLRDVSDRLNHCIRNEDTVARFGGDEFVILLEDLAEASSINTIAQNILDLLAPALKINEQQIFVTASIGISLYPNDGADASTLLKHADTAMYRAKDMGKNTYQFYSAEMSVSTMERFTLESSLRHALERGEFLLHYQPQIDIKSGAVTGAEALLRWHHPTLGLVMPDEFISLLEETGLVIPVGEWVLRNACAQLRTWHDAGWTSLCMAVNLSARQFNSPLLVDTVQNALALLNESSRCLHLEITESVLMQNALTCVENLSRLTDMGCRFAIDDFGTGYSSLSYLKRFPISILKIDRSFTRYIHEDKDSATIVSTIVDMAHNLNLSVIAEGVETHQQLAYLNACGCDEIQGYLFSRPVTADEFSRVLEDASQIWLYVS